MPAALAAGIVFLTAVAMPVAMAILIVFFITTPAAGVSIFMASAWIVVSSVTAATTASPEQAAKAAHKRYLLLIGSNT